MQVVGCVITLLFLRGCGTGDITEVPGWKGCFVALFIVVGMFEVVGTIARALGITYFDELLEKQSKEPG
jgi:hypothetical protein